MINYPGLLESVLLPAYYGLRRRRYPEYRRLLEESQWQSADWIQEFQWKGVCRLLDHAFETVPYYRQKYAAAGINRGDIKTREDFAALPPLTRTEINTFRTELCSNQPGGRLLKHSTGGSSGVPTKFFITRDSYDWRCASTARAYAWSGYRLGARALYLWGAPVSHFPPLLDRTKLKMYRALRRELIQVTFSQTPDLWRNILRRALRFRPKYIVGYVASIEQFAKFLLAEHSTIPGVEGVIAAAEPVFETTRRLAADAYRAPLFNTYGCREFMSIAGECDQHDGLHLNSENLFVETEFPAEQGPSELLVTDLHNYGMPFIRYRIGDVGVFAEGTCKCGRQLPRIRSIEGRSLELLRTRDGRVVPGEFFPHVLKDIGEVTEFQVQQPNLDEIVICLVLNHPLTGDHEALFRKQCLEIFGIGTQVTIKGVESIARAPSGKRLVTVGIGANQ